MPVHAETMERPTDSLSREERVRRRAQELYRLRGDRRAEQAVDEALEASFPASDPPAH